MIKNFDALSVYYALNWLVQLLHARHVECKRDSTWNSGIQYRPSQILGPIILYRFGTCQWQKCECVFALLQVDRPQTVCATVAVGTAKKEGQGEALLERIVTTIYDKCRSNPGCGLIPTFPDFSPLLAEMNASSTENQAEPEYQVTVPHAGGALVVKECFFTQFGEGDNEMKEFHDAVIEHNEKFNKDGVRMAAEILAAEGRDGPSTPNNAVEVVENESLNAEYLATLELLLPQKTVLNQGSMDDMMNQINSVYCKVKSVNVTDCVRTELQVNSQLSVLVDAPGTSVKLG